MLRHLKAAEGWRKLRCTVPQNKVLNDDFGTLIYQTKGGHLISEFLVLDQDPYKIANCLCFLFGLF